ncbi:hypothetical protein KFL_002310110, partial [Klebsormidium nitens]
KLGAMGRGGGMMSLQGGGGGIRLPQGMTAQALAKTMAMAQQGGAQANMLLLQNQLAGQQLANSQQKLLAQQRQQQQAQAQAQQRQQFARQLSAGNLPKLQNQAPPQPRQGGPANGRQSPRLGFSQGLVSPLSQGISAPMMTSPQGGGVTQALSPGATAGANGPQWRSTQTLTPMTSGLYNLSRGGDVSGGANAPRLQIPPTNLNSPRGGTTLLSPAQVLMSAERPESAARTAMMSARRNGSSGDVQELQRRLSAGQLAGVKPEQGGQGASEGGAAGQLQGQSDKNQGDAS